MNIRHNRPAVIDHGIPELDMSQSGFMKPEDVNFGSENFSAASETDDDTSVEEHTDISRAEMPGVAGDRLHGLSDLSESVDVTETELSPALLAIFDELDLIIADSSDDGKSLLADSDRSGDHVSGEFLALEPAVFKGLKTVAPIPQQASVPDLPDGFSLHDDGVYVVIASDEADGEIYEQFLCSPVRVIDRFRKRDGSGWGRVSKVVEIHWRRNLRV